MDEAKELNKVQDARLEAVEKKCQSADATINNMCKDVAVMKTDLDWVKKIQWAVLLMTIGSIGTALLNLIMGMLER